MFDQERIKSNKLKSLIAVEQSSFFQFIYQDIVRRLTLINIMPSKVLMVDVLDVPNDNMLTIWLRQQYPACIITYSTSSALVLGDKFSGREFDLVVHPFGLHWVSDVQGFLQSVMRIMNSGGIFISNFPGRGTLMTLRRLLIELESLFLQKHAIHISPFIDFQQVVPLLQHAGFAENIVDREDIELKHSSALALMKNIQTLGEGNALCRNIAYSITKQMYHRLKSSTDHQHQDGFTDQIILITFVAAIDRGTIKLGDHN